VANGLQGKSNKVALVTVGGRNALEFEARSPVLKKVKTGD